MARDLFKPKPDMVDGGLWFETAQTAAATARLWSVLAISREQPRPWVPRFVLAGERGVGKTALVERFLRAARRNVACELVGRVARDFETPGSDPQAVAVLPPDASQGTRDQWAEDMVDSHGTLHCPAHCHPVDWMPEDALARLLGDADRVHPAVRIEMIAQPHRRPGFVQNRNVWGSPGNLSNDPIRRTTLFALDDADRLRDVPPKRLATCLEQIEGYGSPGRIVTVVYVGSPALAATLSALGPTQVIHLEAMPCDETWAETVRMIFGPLDETVIADLHRGCQGCMGPLLHVARMWGLQPPFEIPPEEIRTLPKPIRDGEA